MAPCAATGSPATISAWPPDLAQWKIWRLEFGDAVRQASMLTFVLFAIEIGLRIGRTSGKAGK